MIAEGAVSGAPVSFGVFELTPAGAETVTPDQVCEALAEAGYAGIDLGPPGFLGDGVELRSRLARFGLELAGGWVQLPFSDDAAFDAALPELHAALARFADAAEDGPRRLPLPTLADDGSAARRGAPGRGPVAHALDNAGWGRLVANAQRAADLVRAAGLEPTFHHHAGTFVETPEEIDRFLAEVDVGLTFDSGHLIIGGGDPDDAFARWGARINHLHLKDVDMATLRGVLEAGGDMRQVWMSGAFVPFGEGGVDIERVMPAAERHGFDGWVVVEQDVLNRPGLSLEPFLRARAADQRTNRRALQPWL